MVVSLTALPNSSVPVRVTVVPAIGDAGGRGGQARVRGWHQVVGAVDADGGGLEVVVGAAGAVGRQDDVGDDRGRRRGGDGARGGRGLAQVAVGGRRRLGDRVAAPLLGFRPGEAVLPAGVGRGRLADALPNASVPVSVTVVPAIGMPVVEVVRLPAGVVLDTR